MSAVTRGCKCAAGLTAMMACYETNAAISIKEEQNSGWNTVVIENEYYRTVLIPDIARLPYSFYYKPAKQEYFVHPVPLTTPRNGQEFIYYGGLIDCLPWVAGKINGKVDTERFPVKGYLHFSPWKWHIEETENSVVWEGETQFDYHDPITQQPASLLFRKRITGYAGSAALKMDYYIQNIGDNEARLTFDIHIRAAINQWDKGDYFYAPGEKCYVYELHNMKRVEDRGVKLFEWTKWPLEEAHLLQPSPEISYCFVYLPADWCVIGDAKTDEALYFVSGPIKYRDHADIMKMGIFMTNAAYVVQPCLSYALQADADIWAKKDATVLLRRGEDCRFQMDMTPYLKMKQATAETSYRVLPECVIAAPLTSQNAGGKLTLNGVIHFAAEGVLMLKSGVKTLYETRVKPGVFDLKNIDAVRTDEPCSLIFKTSRGEEKLLENNSTRSL